MNTLQKELFCILSLFIPKIQGLIDTNEQQVAKKQTSEQEGKQEGSTKA